MCYVARQSGVGKRCHYDNLITSRKYRILHYIYANRYVTTAPQHNLLTSIYEGWNFNSGNYLFTTDTK